MYCFAICEDEKECLHYLAEQIRSAFEECGETVRLDQYDCGGHLIEEIRKGKSYDVLFLDIVMPGICLLYTSPSPRD